MYVGRDRRVARTDLGGCDTGVRIIFVRTMSRGVSKMPARPDALTATMREAKGEGEDRISRPPAVAFVVVIGDEANESPGSGRAKNAEKNERTKAVVVERRSE